MSGRAVTRDRHEIDHDGHGHGPHQVCHERNGPGQYPNHQRRVVAINTVEFGRELADFALDFGFRNQHPRNTEVLPMTQLCPHCTTWLVTAVPANQMPSAYA